jgi:hypothetical protein
MSDQQLTPEQLFAVTTLKAWDLWLGRITKFFDGLTDEQMFTEIAPGKNRAIYLYGHLMVVSDAMIPQMGLGEPSYTHLRDTFLSKPDKAVAEIPSVAELRADWKEVHSRLDTIFAALTPAEWLAGHATVSAEEFAAQPYRNRLSILISRTSHLGYHLGQLMLMPR